FAAPVFPRAAGPAVLSQLPRPGLVPRGAGVWRARNPRISGHFVAGNDYGTAGCSPSASGQRHIAIPPPKVKPRYSPSPAPRQIAPPRPAFPSGAEPPGNTIPSGNAIPFVGDPVRWG